jgi:hypothetical protein
MFYDPQCVNSSLEDSLYKYGTCNNRKHCLAVPCHCISTAAVITIFDHQPHIKIADTSVQNLGLLRTVVTGTYRQCFLVGIHELAS